MIAGYSTYSLVGALQGGMTTQEALDWMVAKGAGHVEIVPVPGFMIENPDQARKMAAQARERGLVVSNYAVSGDLIHGDQGEEIKRLRGQVDIAHALGAPTMRFDNSGAGRPELGQSDAAFETDLPLLARGCREVARYAAGLGLVTMVENHGFYVNGSRRVRKLVEMVGEDSFGVLLDVGNMVCVDEDPLQCVKALLPYTRLLHAKDFYLREGDAFQGRRGWFPSRGGTWLRGAVAGQGDIPLAKAFGLAKEAGYDGYISLEFEGIEDCLLGCEEGLAMVKTLWQRA